MRGVENVTRDTVKGKVEVMMGWEYVSTDPGNLYQSEFLIRENFLPQTPIYLSCKESAGEYSWYIATDERLPKLISWSQPSPYAFIGVLRLILCPLVLLLLSLPVTESTREGVFRNVGYGYFFFAISFLNSSSLQSIIFHPGMSWKSST